MDRHYKWTTVLLPDPSRPRLILRRTPAPPPQSGSSPGSPGTAASGSNTSPSRTPFRVVCSSSPDSHRGPPAGPAPEPKWKKNLRLLMKRRDQAGSRGSRRGAVDEGKSDPGSSSRSSSCSSSHSSSHSSSPPSHSSSSSRSSSHSSSSSSRSSSRSSSSSSSTSSSSSSSSSRFSSCSCFSCSPSPVLSCRPPPPVPEEGWSLVPCAHATRIVLQWPQQSGSSPRPEPPREHLPVRKVPEQQWMKSARLLMKKRSQVGSRWRKRGAEDAERSKEGRKEAKRRGGGRQN